MKKSLLMIGLVISGIASSSWAAEDKPATVPTNVSPDETESKYTQAIEGRTADILALLDISDPAIKGKVHDTIMAQYRALRAWHDENDAKLKASARDTNAVAQINASLKTLHNEFLSRLAANLTPEQIDKVKDKMTYGVVQVTFNAYTKMYPDLTDTEKKQIMAWLVEARETSMDQGSSDAKHAVFGKYKGRINNYLSKQGYDAKTGRKKVAPAETSTAGTNQPSK
jgi:hypothetical protein